MIPGNELPVTLPNGFESDSAWERRATLRRLTTEDEIFLAEDATSPSPAARVTTLLSRCVVRLGLASPKDETLRALTVGDRDALLLHLRRASLGEEMDSIFECPACGSKMDVNLRVSDLLVPPTPHESHHFQVESRRRKRPIRFRLPTGEDQEQIAALAGNDLEGAAAELRARCLTRRTRLTREESDLVDAEMARLDPQAEILLDLLCPSCGADSQVPFDIADHLLHELAAFAVDLYRQIHLLAVAYHWSEAELMRMDRRRRLRYVDLLSREPEMSPA